MSKSTIMVLAGVSSFLIIVSAAIHKRADTTPKELTNSKLELIFNRLLVKDNILKINNNPNAVINNLYIEVNNGNTLCATDEYTIDGDHTFMSVNIDCNSVISKSDLQDVIKYVNIGDNPTLSINIQNKLDSDNYSVRIEDVSKTDSFVDKYKQSFTIKKGN